MFKTSKLKWQKTLFGERDLTYPNDRYLSYVTPYEVGLSVLRFAEIEFKNLGSKVLWDMFAGIGTDSLLFATRFKNVVGTELQQETYACGLKNTAEQENIIFLNEDCANAKTRINADVVYFDPPWGPNFVSGQPFSFENEYLANGAGILDLLERIPSPEIIIKAPLLCDTFEAVFPPKCIKKVYLCTDKKLKFIFVQKK
jgi:hypothetical protein